MTGRKNWTAKRRLALFNTHNGTCGICSLKIEAGQAWDVEHRIPLALGGLNDESNCYPAHAKCHRGKGSKTSQDMADIAKAKRREQRHKGAAKPKGTIKTRGFERKERAAKQSLPPRRLYEMWTPGNMDTD